MNHARRLYCSGKEVRLEELLRHRGRHAIAAPRRQRRQDHRRVHVALVVRGEDDGTVRFDQRARGPRRGSTRTRARAAGATSAGSRAGARAPATNGSTSGTRPDPLTRRRLFGACSTSVFSWPRSRAHRERALVDARFERVLERDHQLDALERAQPQLFERGRGRELRAARRVLRDERRHAIGRTWRSAPEPGRSTPTARSPCA